MVGLEEDVDYYNSNCQEEEVVEGMNLAIKGPDENDHTDQL